MLLSLTFATLSLAVEVLPAARLRGVGCTSLHAARTSGLGRCASSTELAAVRTPVPSMAGFGAASKKGKTKPKKAKASLDYRTQWDIFRELRDTSDQVQTSSVYAKLPDGKWLNVGGIIVEAPGTKHQAVMMHKRLVLEHAARLHPNLAVRARELICGYSTNAALQDEPQSKSEIVQLEKCIVPPGLRAGFQGVPDPKSRMYVLSRDKV